jgi:SAM-dependent methyltransferase
MTPARNLDTAASKGRGPKSYIIRGGAEGRDRLRMMARVLRPSTAALFERAGVRAGMRCLDIGSGGGDVAQELARLVGPHGSVVGIDLDEAKIEIARAEAAAAGLANLEFRVGDVIDGPPPASEVDLVHMRFILGHLPEPEKAVARMAAVLRPGGLMIAQDVEMRATIVHPPSRAFEASLDLYRRAAEARGAHPDIGLALPAMLEAAGLAPVEMHIVQPAGLRGEVKELVAISWDAVVDAVVGAGLATRQECLEIGEELHQLAADETVVMGAPRIVQAWGRMTG